MDSGKKSFSPEFAKKNPVAVFTIFIVALSMFWCCFVIILLLLYCYCLNIV